MRKTYRWTRVPGWACAAAVMAAFGMSAAPASAARGHFFEGAFGSAGSEFGQLENPGEIAVNDATGDVYVVDRGNARVEVFSAAGVAEAEFNGSGLLANEGSAAGSKGRANEKETGRFVEPEGIAVDNTCQRSAESAGHPLSAGECEALDPSNGDVYVVDMGHGVIDKFSASGEYLAQVTETSAGTPFRTLLGVSVDAHGTLWVYQGETATLESGEIDRFNDALVNEFATATPSQASTFPETGFAIDGHERLYVVHRIARVVAQLASSGAVLKDEIDGEEATRGLAADVVTDESFIDGGSNVGVFNASGDVLERLGAGQLVSGSGVGVNAATETVYVADSATDVIDVFPPRPVTVPSLDSESVSDITATSATLSAEINPHGAATHYRFEYGACTGPTECALSGYESRLPSSDGTLGAGFDAVAVSVHPQNLVAGTTYHFRVIAENSLGGAEGDSSEQIFTTQKPGGFGLPDGRAWELVSPPEKHGALVETIGEGQVTQASLGGDAVTYVSAAPVGAQPEGFTNKVQVLSMRGPGGWESRDIAPPHLVATGLSQATGQEYRLFSEDLSRAVVQPFGPFIPASSPQALAPEEASEQTAFLRKVLIGGDVSKPCTTGCYRPLVTALAGHANVPEGTVFGQVGTGEKPCPPEIVCGPRAVGASPDLADVVVESTVALGTPISHDVAGEDGLYEWVEGQLRPVSLLPNEEPAGSHPKLGRGNEVARGAISDDGSRVFWSTSDGHLYMRDTVLGETIELDAVQGGTGANGANAAFQFASPDGSKVFFTDRELLTPDSGGGPNGSHKEDDLYECEITSGPHPTCALTDLTPVTGGESAHVLDELPGASEDGSYVYFVANGKLAGGAVKGTCAGLSSVAGAKCNLYVDHFDGTHWTTSLVAIVSEGDYPDWNGQASQGFLANVTSRVSPNGQWLEFMSREGLTGYDTRDASTGLRDEEVYLYHATSGTLACASCRPTNARPHGVEYKDLRFGLDGLQVWEGSRMLAASVPAWTAFASGEATYQSRYLSNEGRLFFNSSDALVPQDANGTGDVYEYEPAEGHSEAGRCGPATGGGSNVFKNAHSFVTEGNEGDEPSGCLGLISSGDSPEESAFLDADESGSDVFFLTASRLTSQDVDTSPDVYDAHQCTASSPCSTPAPAPEPPCHTADFCRPASPPQPSIFGAPASATLSGVGNLAPVAPPPALKPKVKPPTRAQLLAKALKACKKKRGIKRKTCEAHARRKYGPRHPRKKPHKAQASHTGGNR